MAVRNPIQEPFESSAEFRGTRRFKVLSKLGTGGMGDVYAVFDRERNTPVALKALRQRGGEDIVRFKNEFRARQHIEHRNLVSLGELFEEDGRWFFTMELVEGVDLLSYIRPRDSSWDDSEVSAYEDTQPGFQVPSPDELARAGSATAAAQGFDEQRLRASFAELAQGLLALHASGLVHRDIKPTNVRVTPEGRVVLLDFGLVTQLSERDAAVTDLDLVGTTAYMAPEQAEFKPVGPEADWYSLGVVLYQSLTGALPFIGEAYQILMDKRRFDAPRPSSISFSIPPDLDELCHALLRRNPAERPTGQHVLGALRPAGLVPLVEAAAPKPAPNVFVGRIQELRQLEEAFATVRERTPVCVFIEGESGLGKSALLRAFTADLPLREQVTVLAGRCYERESVPYKALDGIVETLSRQLRSWETAEIAELLSELDVPLLAQAFPALQRIRYIAKLPPLQHDPLQPRRLRDRVLHTVRRLFLRLAERKPLVLAIDDLQWADPDSLALLMEMTSPSSRAPLLLAATYQTPAQATPKDGPPPAPRYAGFTGDVRVITLAPLGIEEACSLARVLLGASTTPTADPVAIAVEAAGHPLFIEELSQHVAQRGGLQRGAKPRLDETVWARVAHLEAPLRQLLELVALAGMPIRQDVLALAMDKGDISKEIATLRAARLIRTTGASPAETVEPYHDKIRQGVARHLEPSARRSAHAQLAAALASLQEPPASPNDSEHPSGVINKRWETDLAFQLAYHYDAAGKPAQALTHALRAAESAHARHALKTAERFYRIAERGVATASVEARRRVAEGLGKALLFLGRYEESAASFRQALKLSGAAVDRAELESWLGEVAFQQEDWTACIDACERALNLLGHRPPHRFLVLFALFEGLKVALRRAVPRWLSRKRDLRNGRSDLLAAQLMTRLSAAHFCYGGMPAAFWAHLRSMNLAGHYPATPQLAVAYSTHALLLAQVIGYQKAIAYTERAMDLSSELNDEMGHIHACYMAGFTAYMTAHYRDAVSWLEQAVRRFDALGSRWESASAKMLLAFTMYRTGSLEEVRVLGPQLYEHAQAAGHGLVADNVLLAWLLSSGGDVPEEAVRLARKRAKGHFHQMWALHAEALWLMLSARDLDGALAAFTACEAFFSKTLDDAEILCGHAAALRRKAATLSGSSRRALLRESARRAARALRAARRILPLTLPRALRESALVAQDLGQTGRALKLLNRSLEAADQQGARFEHAQSLLARSQLKAKLGQPGSEEDLATARQVLDEVGGMFVLGSDR